MKKKIRLAGFFLGTLMLLRPLTAQACTELYVGSGKSADGKLWFSRIEDYSPDYSKQFYVNESGKHKKGEQYQGCFGFTWTFSHDSYSYISFADDNSNGSCPDCGGTHDHTPYQAAGTNEKGLTVTATETIYAGEKVGEYDPYTESGIEEAEITTILLSEAASAREALELLTKIYDSVGSNMGAGTLLVDKEESWYIENMSGTQYIAVKLNPDLFMIEPNIAVIGSVDLDDTENVVASANVIEIAKLAGTFVGDEEQHIIDFATSYGGNILKPDDSGVIRIEGALNYVNSSAYPSDYENTPSDYSITNIGTDGQIVPMYNNIQMKGAFSRDDIFSIYRVPEIARMKNVETHVFSIDPGVDDNTAVEEWVSMGNDKYTVYVPYFPMLTTDVFEAYKTSAPVLPFANEKPSEKISYAYFDYGYSVYPDNWAESYYWTFELLSHIAEEDEEKAAEIAAKFEGVQKDIDEEWEELKVKISRSDDPSAIATEGSMKLAEKSYKAAQSLLQQYGYIEKDATLNPAVIIAGAVILILVLGTLIFLFKGKKAN